MKTDMQLKKDVEDELQWDTSVDAAGIGVEVKDRVVTLSGHLKSYAEKLAAERIVQRVGGVKAVVVELDVRLPGESRRTDEDVAGAVRSILNWTVGVPEDKVHVQVEKGMVTLSGEVDNGYQRNLAERSISGVRGLVGVLNDIRIGSTVEADDVGRKIAEALKRHAEREAKHIEVRIHDGTVTLRGSVSSFAERSVARGVAWSAPGVRAVVDNLMVS